MIPERLLNAVLHLFALQAASLRGSAHAAARGRVLAYLHDHVRLADAATYIGLFDDLAELHRDEAPEELLAQAARLGDQLQTLLHGVERQAAVLRFLVLAGPTPEDGPARRIALRLGRTLGLSPASLDTILRFIADPAASAQDQDQDQDQDRDRDRDRDDDHLTEGGAGTSIRHPRPGAGEEESARDRLFGACEKESARGWLFQTCMGDSPSSRLLGGGEGDAFRGRLAVLRLAADDLLLVAPLGDEPLTLEGRPLAPGDVQPLRPGQVVRDRWGNELAASQIEAAFTAKASAAPALVLRGEHLDFRFPGSEAGLHDFSFHERGGRLIAIMGGSGAGKSTLLNLLNGTLRPDRGALYLNGHDVHHEPAAVAGVFGYIPQDDLLFEDLTVFANLHYAARLCLAQLTDAERIGRVQALLADLGQAETANLKVGSPLQKTISGGQRKRLNIALELIREPTVLFVDEPTSGLSSADAEMVMNLLKQQAIRGKLIFVVIHQPSSKIFRLFDALWVLDQGGWPIFRGSPLEAVAYFRARGGLPGAEQAICPGCGSVNPEQIFAIIEEKLLDPAGQATGERRVSPQAWHRLYQEAEAEAARLAPPAPEVAPPALAPGLHRPSRLGQLKVFFSRDLRARLANRGYLAVNLLEPPLLALVLALVTRGATGADCAYHTNHNLLVFLFMSVVVALFLGLSVSAEEICRDARIQQRERFLHLSWWSYINAKTLYLALVVGVQMLLYLAVAIPLLEIPALFGKAWLLLFACAFASALLGLNISATLRSAVTIYILIPLLLVPQMLLSGVIIAYDDLIPRDDRRRQVPAYANALPSRWGYEALVVALYSDNAYMRHFFATDARVRLAEDDLDYYLPELKSRVQALTLASALDRNPSSLEVGKHQGPRPIGAGEQATDAGVRDRQNQNKDMDMDMDKDQSQSQAQEKSPGKSQSWRERQILQREITVLAARTGLPAPLSAAEWSATGDWPPHGEVAAASQRLNAFLDEARHQRFAERRAAAAERRDIEARLEAELGREGLAALRTRHTNGTLERQVLNLQDLEPIGQGRDGLFHRTLPIYRLPESPWGGAHFLAGHKRLGPLLVPTFGFNLGAILGLSLLLYSALGLRLLPRIATYASGRPAVKRKKA